MLGVAFSITILAFVMKSFFICVVHVTVDQYLPGYLQQPCTLYFLQFVVLVESSDDQQLED